MSQKSLLNKKISEQTEKIFMNLKDFNLFAMIKKILISRRKTRRSAVNESQGA